MTWLLIIFIVVFFFILLAFNLEFIILFLLSRLRFFFGCFLLGFLLLDDFLHFGILIRLSDWFWSDLRLFRLFIGSFFRFFRFWLRSIIWFDDWLLLFLVGNRLVRILLSFFLKNIKSFFFFFIDRFNAGFSFLDGSLLFRLGCCLLYWLGCLLLLLRLFSLWFLYRSLWWGRQLKISFCLLVSFFISISLSMVSFLLIIRQSFPFNTHFLDVSSLT